jgi:hypothetical protein
MPWRRVERGTYSSSEDEQHSSSEYPQRDPPQSSLMRSPERVIPYLSQEQLEQSEPEETEDGEEESEREETLDPVEEGGSESYSSSSSMEASEKREVISATVVALRVPYSVSRMSLVACGEIGFGDTIWETESGRPLGMSETEVSRRASRREEEECLELEEDLEDLEEDDLLEEDGTSRMFRTRPVVGSVVEAWAGSWETW